jgi:hypothetical protein
MLHRIFPGSDRAGLGRSIEKSVVHKKEAKQRAETVPSRSSLLFMMGWRLSWWDIHDKFNEGFRLICTFLRLTECPPPVVRIVACLVTITRIE